MIRDPFCVGALIIAAIVMLYLVLSTRPKPCPQCGKRTAKEVNTRKIPGSGYDRQRPGTNYRMTEVHRYTKYVVTYQCRSCGHRWEDVEERDRRVQ